MSSSTILVGTSRKLNLRTNFNHAEKVSQLYLLHNARARAGCRSRIRQNLASETTLVIQRAFYSTKTVQQISKRASSAAVSHALERHQEDGKVTSKSEGTSSGNQQGKPSSTFGEKCVLASFTVLTTAYDLATLPIYTALHQPWTKMRLQKAQKSLPVDGEPFTYRALIPKAPLHQEMLDHNVNTISHLYERGVEKHYENECLGTRTLVNEAETVIDPNTLKPVKKHELGEYTWKTYREVDTIVKHLTCGLTNLLHLQPKDKIAIFAETREEWFMLAMAAFKKNLTIVTVFTTLANEGIVHALSETEVSTLITSEEQISRVAEVLGKLPKIKSILCFENKKDQSLVKKLPGVKFHWYSDLLSCGNQPVAKNEGPTEEDIAIIMYTSGSTGVPKGVILSHKNVISGLQAAMDSCYVFGTAIPGQDAYIAYLPLAHVLELTSEAMSFIQGVRIGYSSANTLIDNAIGLHENSRGDCFTLKPTIFPAVPLVLERVAKGIQEKISLRGRMVQLLFDYFYNYKLRWTGYGFETPLVDNIIFRRAKGAFGGRVRFIVCGGAPLSAKTQEFVRTVLSSPIGMGYGMTETTSAAIITLAYDTQNGRAGSPITCNKIRLVNWEEGGYRVTDKPNPRGELLIGGDNVAVGYFKRDGEGTFFTDEKGVRWVQTGDIAEIHSDNVFAIIDRKNDLMKLSNGEFVSLGKIESSLKSIPIIENICVFASSATNHVVALIVPDRKRLEKLAQSLGKHVTSNNIKIMCQDREIEAAILHEIQTYARELKLSKAEIPQKIRLCSSPWTPESGLVTGSLKVKRTNIHKEYAGKLVEMQHF